MNLELITLHIYVNIPLTLNISVLTMNIHMAESMLSEFCMVIIQVDPSQRYNQAIVFWSYYQYPSLTLFALHEDSR